MDTKIEGRDGAATFITDSYAVFGVKIVGGPDRPEDPSKYKVRWMTAEDICREVPLTAEQFAVALTLNFPKAQSMYTTDWWPKEILKWKADDVFAWAKKVRSLGFK